MQERSTPVYISMEKYMSLAAMMGRIKVWLDAKPMMSSARNGEPSEDSIPQDAPSQQSSVTVESTSLVDTMAKNACPLSRSITHKQINGQCCQQSYSSHCPTQLQYRKANQSTSQVEVGLKVSINKSFNSISILMNQCISKK